MRPSLALALLLSGCAQRFDLDQVPIEGGTPEQRAAVREGLARFEADAGPGRIQLKQIAFEPLEGWTAGSYTRRSDKVEIEEELSPEGVLRVLRHELCHVLDFTEELVDQPSPLFDGLADGLSDPDLGLLPIDGMRSEREQRSEALARFCDLGPLALSALADRCPNEPAAVGDVADWLLLHIWRDYVSPENVGSLPPPRAEWDAGPRDGPPKSFIIDAVADPAILWISVGSSDADWASEYVDRETGEPWDGPFPGGFPAGDGVPPGLPPPEDARLGLWAGWPDGPGASIAYINLYHLGETQRLLASDGGPWGFVATSCVPWRRNNPFGTVDHQIWFAWLDDNFVRWAPILQ